MINSHIKRIKLILKDYNKDIIKKDKKYYELTTIVGDLEINLNMLDDLISSSFEDKDFKIIWFIITKLESPDYIFRYLELNPNIVNTKDINKKSLFYRIIEYYLVNLNEKDFNIKYYKRIIVMFLESDLLNLTNEELYEILDLLEKNVASKNNDKKDDINFVSNEINRHYSIISTGFRCNATDYANIKFPSGVIVPKSKNRIDLTKLFTISIDSGDINRILIDDAVSLEEKDDETILYLHIPDVDNYILRDSEMDEYMRGIGESIYAHGMKTPMIDYEISKRISLNHGNALPAVTFALHLDQDGNLKNIDFMNSIINVNYNLSKTKANMFMTVDYDKTLKATLNNLYEVCKLLRKNRKEMIGKISKTSLIVEECNVNLDIIIAEYFHNNGIIFPYKNYLGKRLEHNKKHITIASEFALNNGLTEEEKLNLYKIFDINNRVYYDTEALPNSSFNGRIAGNVGNPIREYISLETERLIKDLLISEKDNFDYWEERITRDVIEYTETSAKIRELYKK